MGFGLVLVAGLQLARVTHKCADLLIVIVENCTCSNSFVPQSLYYSGEQWAKVKAAAAPCNSRTGKPMGLMRGWF